MGMVPHADIRVSRVADRTERCRLILLRPHARRDLWPTMAAAPGLVLCHSHGLEWHGTHRVHDSRTHGPFGDLLAPGTGLLLVAIAIGGLGMADDAAPPDRIRARACFPRLATNASPWTIPNAGPDVAPILCYDR